MEEIWKDIKGYEGLYQVSNLGDVRNHKGKVLSKLKNNGNGYLISCLCKEGKQTNHYKHRLVAEAFIPNPENKPAVNHIDADRSNNKVDNLEWVSTKENIHHTIKLGRKTDIGHNSPNTHLTEQDVLDILHLLNTTKLRQREIGILFNIEQSAISLINLGKTHKETFKKYHELKNLTTN